MRTAACFLLTASAALAAPVPKHLMKDGDNGDLAKLQGKWKLVSLQFGETELRGGVAADLNMVFEFRGDSMTVTANDQTVKAKIKLDTIDGFKRFATIDIQKVSMDGKPVGKEEDATFGYLLDGDKLTLATSSEKTPVNPAKPVDTAVLMVLSRVKDKN
jgi:uncharacterized protein (TIGR03067 family)